VLMAGLDLEVCVRICYCFYSFLDSAVHTKKKKIMFKVDFSFQLGPEIS